MTPEREEALKLAHIMTAPGMFPMWETKVLSRALIAAEAELQERDKPVKVSFTDGSLSSFCPFPCGVPLYPKWRYCPNCGRRLEWK